MLHISSVFFYIVSILYSSTTVAIFALRTVFGHKMKIEHKNKEHCIEMSMTRQGLLLTERETDMRWLNTEESTADEGAIPCVS